MIIYISTGDVIAGESDGYIEFVVRLSAPSTEKVTVRYDSRSATASLGNGGDLEDVAGQLVFEPGVTVQTVRMAINNDSVLEKLEDFTLYLSTPTNAVIAKQSATGIVVDNDSRADAAHPATLSVRDVVVDASAAVATFVVMLDKATGDSFSVAWATGAGSADAGTDFIAATGVLAFGAGETYKTVSITLPPGGGAEPTELFNLVLGAVTGAAAASVAIADGSGQAMIGRHGQTPVAAPSISVANAVIGEKDGYIDFVVSLSAPALEMVTVSYDTRDDTAVLGFNADLSDVAGQLVFAPGVTTQTVRLYVYDDTTVEKLEAFTFRLSNPVNAVIAHQEATGIVVDNDTVADSLKPASLSVRDLVVDAATDIATFAVVLDRAVLDSFSVQYATVQGSALAGSDFMAAAGSLTFGAGETVKLVSVALPHNGSAEPAELFRLALGAISGNAAASVAVADGVGQAIIGAHGQTPVATPTISVSNPFVGEKDGWVDFVVSLSAPALERVTVSYDTRDGSARLGAGSDGADSAGQLVFAPGITTQTVRLAITDDSSVEKLEAYILRLSNPTNAVIANPEGIATIVDNDTLADTAQRAGLSVRDVVVDASAGVLNFAVVLDKAVSGIFSVGYATVGSSAGASAGSDFLADSGTLTFGAGETVKNVTIALPQAAGAELAETFSLVLGAVSGTAAASVLVVDGTGQATIGAHGQTAVAKPALQASNPYVSEKAGYVDFVVSLAAPALERVTVGYDLRDISASSNDYADGAGTLVFAPGVTTQVVRVIVTDDATVETLETFSLHLSNAVNATIATPVSTATIIDGSTQVRVTGSAGLDTTNYAAARANFTVARTGEGYFVIDKSGVKASELLVGVERIQFSDMNIGLDIDGTGGQTYRIYQAAFNRAPDPTGLGFWMNAMDKGTSLVEVAAGFMQSKEFIAAYGTNPANRDLVSKIYLNVLHRPAEAAGLDYWANALDTGAVNAAQALSLISESAENQAALLPVIGNGFPYTPYG